MEYEFKGLFNRLNKVCRESYNSALNNCQAKKHYSLEVEDFLLRLLDRADTDAYQILRYYELDRQSLIRQLESTIAMKKRAPDATPIISPQIYELLAQAWLISSLLLNEGQIRSGAIILAMVNSDSFRGLLLEKCTLFLRVPRQVLLNELSDIVKTSQEQCTSPAHLQVVASNQKQTNEPVSQHSVDNEYNLKTFQPNPDEVAAEDYRDLYLQMQDVQNKEFRNNVLLLDTPDIELDKFLSGLSHHMNADRAGACDVKLLRLAMEPRYRRESVLLNLAKSSGDKARACIYIADTANFSENTLQQLQSICAKNKVRFIFHDTMNHVTLMPWLKSYLSVILYAFADTSVVKKSFANKLKRFEKRYSLILDSQAKLWLYKIACQYAKGAPWSVGERILQEFVKPRPQDDAKQLSLYSQPSQKDTAAAENLLSISQADIYKAANSQLNKFVDFKALFETCTGEKNSLNLHPELWSGLRNAMDAGTNNMQFNLLSGGSHAERFYNAQKAAMAMSWGHQRLVVIAQTQNYEDCRAAVVESLLRYRNPTLFFDFDTTAPAVLINLLQDIEAGYTSYHDLNFSLRQVSFYFSTNHYTDDTKTGGTVIQLIKQYAGPWIKQHITEYSFQKQSTPADSIAV